MEITLTNGSTALIDPEDLERVSGYNWGMSSTGYAVYNKYMGGGRKNSKFQFISMARLIMDAPQDKFVDHINRNRLDNRKKNLRLCRPAENAKNRKVYRNNSSGFKGVYREGNKWTARIRVDNKLKLLGVFTDPKTASEAYKNASRKFFKEFAGAA